MKRTSLFFAASLMMMAAISFTSCEKDDDTDSMESTLEQDDDASAYFDDVLAEVDDLTMISDSKTADYATLSVEGQGTRTRKTAWEGDWRVDTITYVDYVNGNSRYERVKNGKVIIRMLGTATQATFERQVSFMNFNINGNEIEGQKRIVKTSEYQYTVTLQNGKITFTDGTTYTRTCERTRTWADGYSTPYYVWDDVYTVEGTDSGQNRKGYTYTHQITNALMYQLGCRWIVEGTIEMTVNGDTATVDYGNGECDNSATVTHNGKSYQLRLRGGM
ncbi:MAG: hypothetical protein AB7S48_07460 [Bacteroidales bacterium]